MHEKEHPGVSFTDLHDLFENAPAKKSEPTDKVASAIVNIFLLSVFENDNRRKNLGVL